MWWYLAIMVVSALISYALAPKPPKPKPPSMEDLSVPIAEEGIELPWIFGDWLTRDPNVVWFGDLSTEAIKKKAGKK